MLRHSLLGFPPNFALGSVKRRWYGARFGRMPADLCPPDKISRAHFRMQLCAACTQWSLRQVIMFGPLLVGHWLFLEPFLNPAIVFSILDQFYRDHRCIVASSVPIMEQSCPTDPLILIFVDSRPMTRSLRYYIAEDWASAIDVWSSSPRSRTTPCQPTQPVIALMPQWHAALFLAHLERAFRSDGSTQRQTNMSLINDHMALTARSAGTGPLNRKVLVA